MSRPRPRLAALALSCLASFTGALALAQPAAAWDPSTTHQGMLEAAVLRSALHLRWMEGSDLQLLIEGQPLPPLPSPIQPKKRPRKDPPAKRAEKGSAKFPGDKLPDPEPVPG